MNNMEEGRRLFEHLHKQKKPLRLQDFPSYVRSLGIRTELCRCRTFISVPMFHQDTYVGGIIQIT